MRIAIIGAGQVGQALSQSFERAGHQTVFGVRDADPKGAKQQSVAEAVANCDIAVLAVPFGAAPDIIRDEAFAGKIVIDATNPLAMGPDGLGLSLGYSESGAERIAAARPDAKVVKAFHQTGFENMADAGRLAAVPLMLIAGDHSDANAVVVDLARNVGFEAIEFGDLRHARLLEPSAMIWIELARKQGAGPGFAFAFTREKQT